VAPRICNSPQLIAVTAAAVVGIRGAGASSGCGGLETLTKKKLDRGHASAYVGDGNLDLLALSAVGALERHPVIPDRAGRSVEQRLADALEALGNSSASRGRTVAGTVAAARHCYAKNIVTSCVHDVEHHEKQVDDVAKRGEKIIEKIRKAAPSAQLVLVGYPRCSRLMHLTPPPAAGSPTANATRRTIWGRPSTTPGARPLLTTT
jgi:hypothetical protein